MKARIWKDREDSLWRFEVRNRTGRLTWRGYRSSWQAVLLLVLPGLEPERPWMRP